MYIYMMHFFFFSHSFVCMCAGSAERSLGADTRDEFPGEVTFAVGA